MSTSSITYRRRTQTDPRRADHHIRHAAAFIQVPDYALALARGHSEVPGVRRNAHLVMLEWFLPSTQLSR